MYKTHYDLGSSENCDTWATVYLTCQSIRSENYYYVKLKKKWMFVRLCN